MTKVFRVIALIAVVGLLAIGCSSDRNEGVIGSSNLANFMLPAGATFESATFNIYVTQPANEQVTIHRVTSAWDEATVTWGNFGGAYMPASAGSFACDDFGWKSADVSGLVASWLNGSNANYGLLLDQPEVFFRTATYSSREAAANRPYIEVCYWLGGVLVCENIADLGDAYIREYYPDLNYGGLDWLGTGWGAQEYLEKQCLLIFDIQISPMKASLGDFVWNDLNEDGVQDAGEPGIPGVTVFLTDCSGQILASTITDANGNYYFTNLEPGDYRVEFVALSGMVFSPQNVGNDAADSDADPTTGIADCTNLVAGENDLSWDAGLYTPQMETGECEGKVTELTLRYDGSVANANIVVLGRRGHVIFDGIVQPGETFTIYGWDRKGTLGTETYYYVNGVYNTNIHTSCSQPVGPGLTKGDFTVIEGYSRNGGLLPPI
ncbi:MAG: SdrD B-like domain-containing protein [bacterium]|nr:SdrD B-like domain-containing protein [bacterium]